MAAPLVTRSELEHVRCEAPDCHRLAEVVLLAPACHDSSCFAEAHPGGEVALICGECGEEYLRLQVAG
jgi:hypothetical protein